MTELEIQAHELSVLREMHSSFVHIHGTDSQEEEVVEFHRRLASEIARQQDSEQLLKSMLIDPDAEPLTVHLAHDDVKTYCNIANNLSLPFLGHQPTPKGVGLSVDSRSIRPYWVAGEYSPFTFNVPDFRAR